MSDARLRRLEREANQSGLPQDWSRYYQESHRAGRITDWQLETAAMLSHPAVKDWVRHQHMSLCEAIKTRAVDDRGNVIRFRIHDLADVWGGDITLYAKDVDARPGLTREALLIALEVTADKLLDFGWHKTLWKEYRESLRTGGWIQNLQAYDVEQLTNSYGLGAPMGLVRDLMDATLAVSNYFGAFNDTNGVILGFWRILSFYSQIGRTFDQTSAKYMLDFCEEFGKRLGDWVLREEG